MDINYGFDTEYLARLARLAGEDYRWDGVRGVAEITSKARAPFRAWLAARQGGICPQCGDALDGTLNFCHIIPRGPLKKGWTTGNVFVGHARCNGYALGTADHAMTFDMFARPDRVFTGPWPSMTAMARLSS